MDLEDAMKNVVTVDVGETDAAIIMIAKKEDTKLIALKTALSNYRQGFIIIEINLRKGLQLGKWDFFSANSAQLIGKIIHIQL